MKKIKIMAATAMMAMVATAGYFGYSAYEQANMTDAERMMQANLEALTDPEWDIYGGEITEVVIECGQFGGACWIWDPSNALDSLFDPCKWDGSPLYSC